MKTKYLDLFEKYYNGEMGPDEKESFETELSHNADMASAFREYLSIYDAISDRETLELRSVLKQIRDELSENNGSSDFLRISFNWLWVAALMTAIICFTIIASLMIRDNQAKEEIASVLNAGQVIEYSGLDYELKRFERRNMDFKLIEPSNNISINRKKPILIKWTVNSADPLILELINWQGSIIYSSGVPIYSPYVIRDLLPAGILAYRFRTDTEAYSIGFIFLK
jgi:hypothetical protein